MDNSMRVGRRRSLTRPPVPGFNSGGSGFPVPAPPRIGLPTPAVHPVELAVQQSFQTHFSDNPLAGRPRPAKALVRHNNGKFRGPRQNSY